MKNRQKKIDDMTMEFLKSRLLYDPETGLFVLTKNKRKDKPYAGWMDALGYIHIRLGDKLYLSHRLAWLYVYGAWPIDNLDHIDGNPSNNRISNLREAPQLLNCRNGITKRKNASIRSGVSFDNTRKKYRAYITVNRRQIPLGRFDLVDDALSARKAAEAKYYGEFARMA